MFWFFGGVNEILRAARQLMNLVIMMARVACTMAGRARYWECFSQANDRYLDQSALIQSFVFCEDSFRDGLFVVKFFWRCLCDSGATD